MHKILGNPVRERGEISYSCTSTICFTLHILLESLMVHIQTQLPHHSSPCLYRCQYHQLSAGKVDWVQAPQCSKNRPPVMNSFILGTGACWLSSVFGKATDLGTRKH